MAITATLVFQGRNRLRYIIAATAGAGEAVGISLATLVTDTIAGALKNIANTNANGYGKIAAGTILTQAQGRAMWLSDDAVSVLGAGIPSAQCTLTNRTTATANAFVDAGTLGSLVVTANGIGTSYLDIMVPGALGS